MADELEPQPLPETARSDETRLTGAKQSLEALAYGSPNQLAEMDVDKLKLLFELQEKQRSAEHKRELELREQERKFNRQESERLEKERKNAQHLEIQKLETYFKMFIAVTVLAIGTVFVLFNHTDVGYFMIGGAMSMVTSGIVGLMRAAKGTQHG